MRKRSILFRMFCVVSFVVSLFSMSFGFSDYVVSKTTYDETSTLSSQAKQANESGEKVTVTLKYLFYDRVDFDWEDVSGHTDVDMGGGTDSAKYDALYDYFSKNVNSSLLEKNMMQVLLGQFILCLPVLTGQWTEKMNS